MAYTIQTGEFVQILNTSHSHWLTITTIGVEQQATIKVYDSMYDCLPRMAQAQVASILCTRNSIITVEMMDVKKQVYEQLNLVVHVYWFYSNNLQSGGCDCGLYAIAYATAIAYGEDPCQCEFDQPKMRQHFYQCLEAGKMKPFPHRRVYGHGKISNFDNFEVHCRCRMPELKNTPMIECTKCKNWYHFSCEDVVEDKTDTMWLCHSCLK